jgi:hypothetical protein
MGRIQNCDLLISGGTKDPNLRRLADAAFARNLNVKLVLFDRNTEPPFTYDLQNGNVKIHGETILTRAVFTRYDVFSFLDGGGQASLDQSQVWYSAIIGWCLDEPSIHIFNRHLAVQSAHKVSMLKLARRLGFRIPGTAVTNEWSTVINFSTPCSLIAKPVVGGAYCQPLESLLSGTNWNNGTSPYPAFVQEKLTYPEYRAYLIGDDVFVFEIRADDLDYRNSPSTTLKIVDQRLLGDSVIQRLKNLAGEINATFCAFDLKSSKSANDICFLEVNTAPMFVGFDSVANGALSNALLDYLVS